MQTIPHNKILNRTPPEVSKQHWTSTPTLYKKTFSTTPQRQITNPTRIPIQNHPRNTPNTKLSPKQLTTTRHPTLIWLPEVASGPGPRGAVERSRGGRGAADPLVGSAGVGPGAGMRGGGSRVGPPWGRQQQQQPILCYVPKNGEKRIHAFKG